MLLQNQTKKQAIYDHKPYTVTEVKGTQITARKGEKVRTRDSKKFKKVSLKQKKNYGATREHPPQDEDDTPGILNSMISTPALTANGGAVTNAQVAPAIMPADRFPNRHLLVDTTLRPGDRHRQQPDRFVAK